MFGFVDACFQPAYTVAVPEIVSDDLLLSANAGTSLSKRAASIGGPTIGAALIAVGGTSLAFGLDALPFVVSAPCLLPLALWPQPPRATWEKGSAVRALGDGIRTVLAIPWLWITIGIAVIGNMTINAPLSVGLPFLVHDRLRAALGSIVDAVASTPRRLTTCLRLAAVVG